MADLSEMERELLTVVARAFVDCREPLLRMYLSDAMAWVVQYKAWRDARPDEDCWHDSLSWVSMAELGCLVRRLGWPSPSPEQEEALEGDTRTVREAIDEARSAEHEGVLRAFLRGE